MILPTANGMKAPTAIAAQRERTLLPVGARAVMRIKREAALRTANWAANMTEYYYGKGNCYWDQYYDEDCYCSSRAGAPTIKYSGYTERTRNCEDLPEYGSDYEGTFKDRYNHNTCSWENVSNTCKLKCSNSTYKSSHKSECCPGVSTSDSVCYKNCSRTVSAGTYSWKVISQNTGTCNAQRGCLNADSNACTKSCDKVHAGISCTKYSPSGSISLGTQWTSTTTVCSENTKTETYRCKNGW